MDLLSGMKGSTGNRCQELLMFREKLFVQCTVPFVKLRCDENNCPEEEG